MVFVWVHLGVDLPKYCIRMYKPYRTQYHSEVGHFTMVGVNEVGDGSSTVRTST